MRQAALVTAACLAFGCADPAQPLMTLVEVTPPADTLEALEDTARFTASAKDSRGTPVSGGRFRWASSDTTVATADSMGLVTAVGSGTAIISASVGQISGSASLTVVQIATEVSVSLAHDTLGMWGDTVRATAAARDAGLHVIPLKQFRWASSDTTVATVDSAGLVTAVGNGSTNIRATTDGVTGAGSIVVAQPRVAKVQLTPPSDTLWAIGDTARFGATARDTVGRVIPTTSVRWASLPSAVATVDSGGLVTAAAPGQALITATIDTVTGTALVTVVGPVTTVEVWPPNPTLTALGAAVQMAATARDGSGVVIPGRHVTWFSSDPSYVTITALGLADAIQNGTSTITATCDGISGITTATVAQRASVVVVSPPGAALGGATQAFAAEAWDSLGHPISGKSFVWGSLNSTVATVASSTGIATGVGSGQVPIFATADGAVGYALLTVSISGVSPVTSWNPMDTTSASLYGIWGSSESDVYAVGAGGTVVHFDGSAWTAEASGTTEDLTDVWGASALDVWAVGAGGTLLHRTDAGWSHMASGTTKSLQGVWGSAPNDVYAVGHARTVLHYDGRGWSAAAGIGSGGSGTGTFVDIWGTSRTSVYVADFSGPVLWYDGSLAPVTPPGDTLLPQTWRELGFAGASEIWGTSDADVYFVWRFRSGIRCCPIPYSELHRYDGTGFTRVAASGAPGYWFFVWGTSSSEIYLGPSPSVWYDGTRWSAFSASADIRRAWGTSHAGVYLLAAGSWNGTTWPGVIIRGTRK